jgi:spore maturation protein CgeB
MNIIFYRYKSICEPDYIDAFKALGVDVLEDSDGMDQSLALEEKINHLGNMIYDNKPLFVFSINYMPFIAILCEKLHVFYVAMTVDCPVFEIYNISIRSKFNRVFLFDNDQYLSIRDENPECIFHLPLGAANARLSETLGDTNSYKYNISFVGSLYSEKDPLSNLKNLPDKITARVNSAIEHQFEGEVYGLKELSKIVDKELVSSLKECSNDFYPSDMSVRDISEYVALNDYLGPHMAHKERLKVLNLIATSVPNCNLHLFTQSKTSEISDKVIIHGGVNSLTEMPFVFRQSKINLNITMRPISSGLSQRIWDVLGCKGFLLTNYQPEIDMFFKDGEHLVTYKSYAELVDKATYYLNHEDERRRIAENGFSIVNKNGSVLNRVIEILRIITNTN